MGWAIFIMNGGVSRPWNAGHYRSEPNTMLFPISDDDRRISGPAYVTWGLLAANVAVFVFLQELGANESFTYGWSVIPQEIMSGEDLVANQTLRIQDQTVTIPQAPGPSLIYLTILSAMFMHGGFAHLFGNLLYLWIFGDNVEHRFGAGAFLSFYLVSGIVATVAQIALNPDGIIPNLGASGAISGVLGAYLVLFPKNRVTAIFLYHIVSIPAVAAIGVWIVFQFFNGLGSVMISQETVGGVAYGAHIGGFFAGVVLALILRIFIKKEKEDILTKQAQSRRGR